MLIKDLKIIELSSVLAGPLVGTFFAELGASVIKVENKKNGGDVTRTWKMQAEPAENHVSAYYASANFGKENIFLDFSQNDNYQMLIELIKDADIVIVNFKQGDAEKFKLSYAHLKSFKSDLIYASITGFGDDDPRLAFDVVLQAETGFMSMNGEPQSRPLKMPLALIDILAAHQLKEGILIALLERKLNGAGAQVKVSLFDAAVTALANQASNYLMNDNIPQAIGSLHPNIAPYGELFETADKHFIVLAVGSDRQFANLCHALHNAELINMPEFSTNSMRVANRNVLQKLLQAHFHSMSADETEQLLLQHDVPFGRVRNLKEVFSSEKARRLTRQHHIEGQLCTSVKTVAFELI